MLVATLGPPGRITRRAAGGRRSGPALAALLAVALGAACAGVAAWSADRRATSSRLGAVRRRVPWEAALLVATVVTTVAVLGTDVARRPASPLAVVFPLLVAASVALLVLRGLERAGVRRWVRARAGSPRWLAGQRARTTAGDAAAITLVAGRRASRCWATPWPCTAASPRASTTRSPLRSAPGRSSSRRRAGRASEPPAAAGGQPRARGHRRLSRPGPLPPAFGNQAVLAVDSRTFAAAADWGATGDLTRGRGAARRPAAERARRSR